MSVDKKTNKYNAKKVEVDGIKFDSKMEADFYLHLKELQKQGIVEQFVMQPKFELLEGFEKNGKKVRPINYIADFRVRYSDGREVIYDVKGKMTKDFAIKKKLFDYCYRDIPLVLIRWKNKKEGWQEVS